ncbi:hypothetical protein EKO27_g5006 [Xylaria grammica]|uniref:FAD/NAD(P)-binding domain-containing protein n=1 Tax=Xylaria grammica TaxID=363999 RepID=A0A439D6S8_9PEZI|nr:hypothetical protein EKO27_g5006 [Xylaria grammica]
MATAKVEPVPLVPSHMRCVPGSVNIKVARFPSPTKHVEDVDPSKIASNLVGDFNKALAVKDYSAVANLFAEDGYWRDHLALSWVFRTIQTPPRIVDFLQSCTKSRDGFRLKSIDVDARTATGSPKIVPVDASEAVSGIQFFIKVTTVHGAGVGLARLVKQDGQWKIFTLYTRLEELAGHEEAISHRRVKGAEHGGKPGRKNWAEKRVADAEFTAGNEPAVLVIGAGQAGLTAAARLKMLGVDTLIIDQNERVGDNWRKRYHQLVLHDPVWYDHMPYLNFPAQWPIFTPKDKLAQFFESYANLLELNVWTKTELVYTKWDESKKVWTVIVNRKREDGTSDIRTFHPRHLIQATGHSGKKNQPSMKGVENFKGDRLCHSSEFPGARENSQSKKAIVVGSCNSAHDIAQDFLEKGYDITIVQRSSTHVVSSKAITEIALKGLYSEDGPPVDDADLLLHGLPTPVLKAIQIKVAERQAESDKDMLDGLDKAGFKVDRGPDGAGLFFKYFQRGGGYYIDVGASQLIADGKIKVKQGKEIDEVLPRGLRFEDGTELEADEIVFATGYQNMRTQTRLMFGDEVADRVGDVWGFNSEGEIRTIWQRSGHPGFWFHGGNLAMCRYYSRLLALQIKGLEEGLFQDGEI